MIVTSLNNLTTFKDIEKLATLGIGEFYIGYMPKEWYSKYGWEISTNRRYFPVLPHLIDPEKAKKTVSFIHSLGKKVFLALNELYYIQEQHRLLFKIIELFENIGIDGYIVSDLALIMAMRKRGITKNISLSSCAGCYNLETISFYRQFGINHFILSQNYFPEEIINLLDSTAQNITFEVFILGELCYYENALCFTAHGFHREHFCALNYNKWLIEKDKNRKEKFDDLKYRRKIWCRLCILPQLIKYKKRIKFKIATRGGYVFGKVNNSLMKKVSNLLEKGETDIKKWHRLKIDICKKGTDCIYKNKLS